MSLNWSVADVHDYKNLCYERRTRAEAEAQGATLEELLGKRCFLGSTWYVPGGSDAEKLGNAAVVERLRPVTNCLIWATMSIDMGRITEDNWQEFFARIALVERCSGSFMQEEAEDGKWVGRTFTPEEIRAHIGLRTNVSTTGWLKFCSKTLDAVRENILKASGVENTRPARWQMPVSEAVEEIQEPLRDLREIIQKAELYSLPEDDPAWESQWKDASAVDEMSVQLHDIKESWEDIETRIRAAEEEE
ncbi:hypothetical protein CMI37_16455 [Candidatus Pacearchaeota archaeon]|nr:hypothetical protein [Candidatus Pacearchaeota archaeon]|tara:strand:+ start:1164 stop:1907 length:744 start_codon:yes stop_codon:yes gene_type:complete